MKGGVRHDDDFVLFAPSLDAQGCFETRSVLKSSFLEVEDKHLGEFGYPFWNYRLRTEHEYWFVLVVLLNETDGNSSFTRTRVKCNATSLLTSLTEPWVP